MRLRLFLPLALLLQSGVVSADAPNGKTIAASSQRPYRF